jgi:hypothetical protein
MGYYKHEENLRVTAQKVKQMPGWENLSDEMAENISNTIKKFAELFYITIARDMNLNPIPETENPIQKEKPKKEE